MAFAWSGGLNALAFIAGSSVLWMQIGAAALGLSIPVADLRGDAELGGDVRQQQDRVQGVSAGFRVPIVRRPRTRV